MSQHNNAESTQPIREDRNEDRHRDKECSPPVTAVHHHRKKTAENDRGDQKTQTRARLCNLERALRDFDHQAVRKDGDMEGVQTGNDNVRGDGLQPRDQKGSARDQKEEEKQRRQQQPEETRPEHGEDHDLEHRHHHQLAALLNIEHRREQPNGREDRHQKQWPQRRARRHRSKDGAPLPEQEACEGNDQKAVIIGGRVDPYLHCSAYLALKHDGENETRNGDDHQRRPPAGCQSRTDDRPSLSSGREDCHAFTQSNDSVGALAGARRGSRTRIVGNRPRFGASVRSDRQMSRVSRSP